MKKGIMNKELFEIRGSDTIRADLRKKGMEQGMEQGIEHGKLEVAKRLLAKGMSIEEAAEIAGVTVDILLRYA